MMKYLTALAVWLNWPAYGQGNFTFDNVFNAPDAPVTISSTPGSFNPGNGSAGAYVGSDYTASLYYLNGNVTDQVVFDSSSPIFFQFADVQFSGTTGTGAGHGFSGDGSGFFDRGIVTLPTTGPVTVQVRAWYNGGGFYTSYSQALAAGQNVGKSNPIAIDWLAIGLANPPPLEGLLPFTVGIPEPSTFALAALGSFCLLFRRHK